VNLHSDIGRREPRNLGDGGRVHLFEIRNDDLPVQGLELPDEVGELPERPLAIDVRLASLAGSGLLDLFEAHESHVFPALAVHVGNSGVVSDAKRPRLQRAAAVKKLEASPELKVDVLPEVVALFGVGFVSGGQTIEGAAEFADGGLVQFVLDNSSYPQVTVDIQVTLSTPANATGPVPVIMEFGFTGFGRGGPGGGPGAARGPAGAGAPPGRGAPGGGVPGRGMPVASGPTWQQQVLAKGWGYAVISPNSVQADNGAGLTQGIIGLVNKGQPRKLDDWGALRAWAWGASRALDYFETDKSVDAKRVGLEGHSRYGKATVVAVAYDQRFAIAFVSSSGEGGAKIHRRNWGELVENVAGTSEYHWMAGNFLKYAGPLHWNDLPVDSHELVALCAPRPVFISGGATQGDGWVDAKGMFLAAAGAGPVYKLLGKKDMGTTEFPPIETPLIDGDVAFRQHSSGHTPGPNWPVFLTFAERYFKPSI